MFFARTFCLVKFAYYSASLEILLFFLHVVQLLGFFLVVIQVEFEQLLEDISFHLRFSVLREQKPVVYFDVVLVKEAEVSVEEFDICDKGLHNPLLQLQKLPAIILRDFLPLGLAEIF